MKRTSIAVCILLLCSSLLIVGVGTVMGFAAGYEFSEYWAPGATIDGKWTTPDEWVIGEPHYIGTVQKGMWIMQANSEAGYAPQYLIEFADNTPDAGDIIQVCMNGGVDSTTPTAAEFKMEIQGLTTKKVYQGTGTGWAESSTAASAVTVAATVTTSAHDPAQHVIAEFSIDKATLAGWGAPPLGVRIACYDASTGNWVAWPPASSADNPSTWGLLNNYSATPFPEGLTLGVMLLVSSVAAVVSIRYFRKPSKL
jgi:hypothetical protein